MSRRIVQVVATSIAFSLVVGLSGCIGNLKDPVKENGDADMAVSWLSGNTTCNIKGNDEGQTRGLHWMPTNKKPGIYDQRVCRGGRPVHYILHNSGKLQVSYQVTYTITDKVDREMGSCIIHLTPVDRGWGTDFAEIGKLGECGKLKVGGKFTKKQTSDEALPVSYSGPK